ncbi:MAG TPA: 1-acyl-sn-glycerol-3-phosphate acyltransferase [Candidatus Corynebacterium avicola]|uniref:1-acyl-sn-glycerol-3-phosphate acyltransferase n=1 Tax=Candidatus Corynebacterium avicola TaxID=2838527 RepID=A0A9D1RSC8_9CORY|nr:1-acyl-sn-glycerol-3-phosphate acyltransferase [Candidatus Corynebacterium avicola]
MAFKLPRDHFWLPKGFSVTPKLPDTTPHPESREPFYGRIIIPFAKLWMRRMQHLEVEIQHPERIPATGGAVLAVNHTGYWDFVYGAIPAAYQGGRLVRFMAKKEIWDNKIAGAAMSGCKHIQVDRADGAASVREATERAAKGELIGIFPEATISRSFEIKEVKDGAGRIAQEAGVPLIPVVIWGSQRVWTKGRKPVWRPKKTTLVVSVGEPVEIDEDSKVTAKNLHDAMVTRLDEVRARYDELYGPFPEGEYWMPKSLGGSAPTLEEATVKDREDAAARRAAREQREAEKAANPEAVKQKKPLWKKLLRR